MNTQTFLAPPTGHLLERRRSGGAVVEQAPNHRG